VVDPAGGRRKGVGIGLALGAIPIPPRELTEPLDSREITGTLVRSASIGAPVSRGHGPAG
jgi:hypothetical protein